MAHKNRKPAEAHRKQLSIRLPQPVIDALMLAAGENGTSITDEIEARLVETLIADGLLNRDVAVEVCGAFAATSVSIS